MGHGAAILDEQTVWQGRAGGPIMTVLAMNDDYTLNHKRG
jgi:hypothetical protein